MPLLKLGIFTDSHYSSQEITCKKRYNSRSLEKIEEAYEAFREAGCNLIVCLGDLIDKEPSHAKEIENLSAVAAVINRSKIPTVCLMGNHDAFAFEPEEFYGILGGCEPKNCQIDGKNLIFLDACHGRNGERYHPGDSDWRDTDYPYRDALKQSLSTLRGDTYVFIHQNLGNTVQTDHRLFHAEEICEIIEKSGVVKTVYQGHYHPGAESRHGNVRYVTFPAMCEGKKMYFIEEI